MAMAPARCALSPARPRQTLIAERGRLGVGKHAESLSTTISRVPYAPRACSAACVSAGSNDARERSPEPCAQVRILLGAQNRTRKRIAFFDDMPPDLG